MQLLLCFFVSIFLFAGAFLSSVSSLTARQQYRLSKQNLILTGRELVNHISMNLDGTVSLDEAAMLECVSELHFPGEILGGIFAYKNSMTVLKMDDGAIVKREFSTQSMREQNKINTVNNMLHFILDDRSEQMEINIASENSNDYLKGELFNKLAENTVFIIGHEKNMVFLSGFVLETQTYPQHFVDK